MTPTACLIATLVGTALLAAPAAAQQPAGQRFAPTNARAGQPVAPSAPEPVNLRDSTPEPAAPSVAPGVHLSPAVPAQSPGPSARAKPAPVALPPQREASSPEAGKSNAHSAPIPPTNPRRRSQCTEILQRATIGELTEEDRAILKTQCR